MSCRTMWRLFTAITLSVSPRVAQGAVPFTHAWGTVADLMGMHGSFGHSQAVTQASIEFVAHNYAVISIANGCSNHPNPESTYEEEARSVATAIKAANPKITLGMYWYVDSCSRWRAALSCA
jgi:hypothetical protein